MKEEWLDNQYTQELRKNIQELIDQKKDQWGNGDFLSDDYREIALMNVKAVTQIETLEVVLEAIS